jgi:hypothetical protein
MKELKKTSTPSKASPVYGEGATENRGNRRFSDFIKVNRTIKEPV